MRNPEDMWRARAKAVKAGGFILTEPSLSPVPIWQSLEELKVFSLLLEVLRPKTILEIGSAYGGALWWWMQVCPEDATFISIDPNPMGSAGWESWLRGDQKLFVVRKNSQSGETVETVRKILNGKNLDFLFIDGDHHMPVPRLDYENYSPFVGRGIIAVHDTEHPKDEWARRNPDLAKQWDGLTDYWRELSEKVKKEEGMLILSIRSSSRSVGCVSGIGVILKGIFGAR